MARDLAEDAIVDVVREMHPELGDVDVFAIARAIATTLILKSQSHRTDDTEDGSGNKKPFVVVGEDNTQFVNINGKFVNIDELDFSLIEAINPFADAYQFISKTIDPMLLKQLQEETARMREKMTMDKAMELWPYINRFVEDHKRKPDIDSTNDFERRLAIALAMIVDEKRKRNAMEKAEGNS